MTSLLALAVICMLHCACAKTLEQSLQVQGLNDEVVLSRVKRIISGDELPEGKWPWLVHIRTEASYKKGSWWCFWCGRRHFNSVCGGAIVHQNWVLTAAHCVYSSDGQLQREIDEAKSMHISFGEVDIDCGISRGFNHFFARFFTGNVDDMCHVHNRVVIRHPDYKDGNNHLWANDVALIKVNVNLLADSQSGVLEMPPDDSGTAWPSSGDMCYTHGWGCTSGGAGTSDVASGASLPIASHADCQGVYGPNLSQDKHLCAGGEGPSVCQGDSGGPLVCYSRDRSTFYQAGVVSFFSARSYATKYSGFARVSNYKTWIQDTING